MRYIQQNGILVPQTSRTRQRGFIVCGPAFFGSPASSGGDPYWSDVASLCYYQGSNGSTTITDQVTASTWTAHGTAAISTAQAKFGTSSLRLPGTSGSYVDASTAISYWNVFNTSTPWTVEVWLRVDAITSNLQVVYDMGGVATAANGIALCVDATTGKLDFRMAKGVSGGYNCLLQAGAVVANTWTLAAACYSGSSTGNTVYLFQDGTLIASGTPSVAQGGAVSTVPCFGRYVNGNQFYMAGYIGEARWTAGVCRHTSSYTPDASQWPNHA